MEMRTLTHKTRALLALEGRQPDYVPTFELSFQLTEEAFGVSFHRGEQNNDLSEVDRDQMCRENAELYLRIAERYEHSIVNISIAPSTIYPQRDRELVRTLRYVRELSRAKGEDYLLTTHGDATLSIPQGERLEQIIEILAEAPEQLEAEAEALLYQRSGHYLYLAEAGFDGFVMCDDYAFNANPFFSPAQFARFVQPYLARLIRTYRDLGKIVIKHSDGNIMPILDQLVACAPHALHSLDPQGGVDIAEVKRRHGGRVALCGNVNCGLLQSGTEADALASCEYALRHGKPGGGYLFCTSNCVFKGLPLDRYELMHAYWKKHRAY